MESKGKMPRKRAGNENQEPSTSKRSRIADDQVQQNHCQELSNFVLSQSNEWGRSGKIIRVHLINFMCHENLEIDFNNRVNLLIGRNGSGKSAILTALVIGLGAKASKTNRSANLKNLIRSGENSAIIEIEINNRGYDAYDRDTYGDKIIVKRKLLASGGSSYELKDERGHTVSKNREDLLKMLLYLNIQTDNPVFVLNQDAARTFLKDLDPIKNYILFQKATQVELILEKLNKCVVMYNDYKIKVSISKKGIEAFEKEVADLEGKYERLKSVEDIKLSIRQYKLERIWLRVTEQENKIRTLKDEINVKERERDDILEKISGNSSNADGKLELRKLRKEVEEQNLELEKENRILADLRARHKEEQTKYQNEAQEHQKLKQRYKTLEEHVRTIENEISKRTESSSSRNTQLRREVEEKMEQLNKRRTDIKAMLGTLTQELHLNEQNKEKQNEQFQTMKHQRVAYENRIGTYQQELAKISTQSNDRMEIYGPYMNSLLEAIDHAYTAGTFSAKPKGPLGSFLNVSDRKWRGVIEQLIGHGLLRSFLVNSGQDRMILDNLIKTQFSQARHTIITTKFRSRIHDVRGGAVSEIDGAQLLMNLIQCSDPDIVNCLIDHVHMETILLVDNQNLAQQLTSDENNVPKNLLKVILLDPLIEYFPSPAYRAYSLQPQNPRYIQVNLGERKLALQEEVKKMEHLKRELEEKLQNIRKMVGDFEQYAQKKQELLRNHKTTLNRIEMELEELKNTDFPSENEDEILRMELGNIRKSIEKITIQVKEKEVNGMQLKQIVIEANKALQKQQSAIGICETTLASLQATFNAKQLELQKLGSNARLWTIQSEKLNENIVKLKTDYDAEEQKLSEFEENASKLGDRINTDRTDNDLGKKIVHLETKVKEICSTDENIDEIKALLDNRLSKLKKDKACIESLDNTLQLLKKSRLQRFKLLKTLHEHMSLRVSHTFRQILKIKDFDGQLDINHIEKTLKIQIVPRDKHIETAVSNSKSLSGGERSYTTVALLLALWSCVDHPFYFLDEYDVFTDQYNREIMTKLLLNEATKKAHRQYTFLSPQNMSFVKPTDTVKIHKLADPKP